MKKIDVLIILFIIITSIFSLKDLFIPGFYTSHDGPHQIVRAFYYDKLLREGQIPPRWVMGLNYGFGYPLFIFSYHLPWIINEPFRLSGLSVIDSVKMTFLSGFILSGIFMYLYQKKLFGRLAALAGTVIYLYAPFRFSNIFVRAAIGDATAFIFPPLIFLSLLQISRVKKNLAWQILLGISLSGLLLSHAMVFFFYAPVIGLYFLVELVIRRSKKKLLTDYLKAILIFVGLSAFYFLPSLYERSFTEFNRIMGSAFIGATFVPFSRLLYDSWGYGMMKAEEGRMSLQIGLAQWLSVILALISVPLFLFLKKKKFRQRPIWPGIFFPVIFFLTVIMMLEVSLPVWKLIEKIAVIDFSWRILSVTVFAASISAGFAVSRLKNKYFGILAAAILVFFAFYANRNHTRINQSLDWTVDFFLKLEKTTNSFDEYTPRWAKQDLIKPDTPKVLFDGKFQMKKKIDKSNLLDFSGNFENKGKVRINTLYYPGWAVFVDGIKKEIDYSNGLLEFEVEKGEHQIEAHFEETPLRRIADSLSLFTIIIVGYSFFKNRKHA